MAYNYLLLLIVVQIVILLVHRSSAAGDPTSSSDTNNKDCLALNRVMLEQSDACRCFDQPSFVIDHHDHDRSSASINNKAQDQDQDQQADEDDDIGGSWIGCSKEKMPAIYKALTELPDETNLTQLWIWDSFMPMIPSKTFAKLRPYKLIIERCRTGDFSGVDVFGALGDRLTELELKNNVLRDVNADLLAPLRRLRRLDLSVNLLSQITNSTFGRSMPALRSLSLYRNQLTHISVGSLDHFRQLRSLNLASNRLTALTAGAIGNLRQLEYLNLENNRIGQIEPDTFLHLTKLRRLNLGGNRLSVVHFPAPMMPVLRQLLLNNNSLGRLEDIRMGSSSGGSMPGLESLYLDENKLKTLSPEEKEEDGSGILLGGRWPSLRVLSLASNQLTKLTGEDFRGLINLKTLSLQGNRLERLSSSDDQNGGPFTGLTALNELFLSQNEISELGERTLEGLTQLRVLTLARNKLASIDEHAFDRLPKLEKLFLNDNNLKYLNNATFDVVQSTLSIIDLSDNLWSCDCDQLWLARWISSSTGAGDDRRRIVVDLGKVQCAENQNQNQDRFANRPLIEVADELARICGGGGGGAAGGGPSSSWNVGGIPTAGMAGDGASNNAWITILGVVLGVVSILILLAVSYLYFQEAVRGRVGDSGGGASGSGGGVLGRWATVASGAAGAGGLRRVPSDMVNLIPKCSAVQPPIASSARK